MRSGTVAPALALYLSFVAVVCLQIHKTFDRSPTIPTPILSPTSLSSSHSEWRRSCRPSLSCFRAV